MSSQNPANIYWHASTNAQQFGDLLTDVRKGLTELKDNFLGEEGGSDFQAVEDCFEKAKNIAERLPGLCQSFERLDAESKSVAKQREQDQLQLQKGQEELEAIDQLRRNEHAAVKELKQSKARLDVELRDYSKKLEDLVAAKADVERKLEAVESRSESLDAKDHGLTNRQNILNDLQDALTNSERELTDRERRVKQQESESTNTSQANSKKEEWCRLEDARLQQLKDGLHNDRQR